MQQWEYQVKIFVDGFSQDDLTAQDSLNQEGQEGWELTSTDVFVDTDGDTIALLWLKRPIESS